LERYEWVDVPIGWVLLLAVDVYRVLPVHPFFLHPARCHQQTKERTGIGECTANRSRVGINKYVFYYLSLSVISL